MRKVIILLISFCFVLPLWAGNSSSRALVVGAAAAAAADGKQEYEPTGPCYLAQLPRPVANEIAGYCRFNDLVEQLKRQPELRSRFFLKDNDFYRKVDPERALSSLSWPTKLINGPKRHSRFWAYNIPHMDKFAFAGDLLLLLHEVEGVEHDDFPSAIDLKLVRRYRLGMQLLAGGATIYRLTGGTPVNSYMVWPFTASQDEQNVFYVESIDGGLPQLVHQQLINRHTLALPDFEKMKTVILPDGEYSEIKYLPKTNQIMLLKKAQSDDDSAGGVAAAAASARSGASAGDYDSDPEPTVVLISLDEHEVVDDSTVDVDAGAATGDKPAETAQENLLVAWLREKGVCKTLAASLPEPQASLDDLE